MEAAIKQLALALAFLILSTTSASASLSLSEKSHVALLGIAGTWLDDGNLYLAEMIPESNAANLTYLNGAWTWVNAANLRLARGISLLVGGDPTFATAGVGSCQYDPSCAGGGKPRAMWVTDAFAEINAAIAALTNAQGYFATAAADTTQSSTFRSNATHAQTVSMASAIAYASAFSQSFTYANPETIYFPNTVGPHGFFQEGISDLFTAIDFSQQGLELIRSAWCWTCNGDPPWPDAATIFGFSRFVQRMANIMGKMRFMMFAYSLIPVDVPGNPNTCAKSPFRLIADAYENMISNHSESQSTTHCCAGIPYHFDNMGIQLTESGIEVALFARSATARASFFDGWKRMTLSAWRFSDGAVWKGGMEFPSTPTLTTLRQQANFANDPFAPPLCPDSTPPTVAITNPTASQTVGGTITATADASDNIAVSGVQFLLDNVSVCAEDKLAPYQCSINTTLLTNGSHTIKATAHDAANNQTTSATITFTVSNVDTIAPVISIPIATATGLLFTGSYIGVSGTVTLTSSCTDNIGCVGVQYKVDGTNQGAETTVAPWSRTWDTTAVANGNHTVTAVARDAAGNTTTSASLTVKVGN